MQRVILHVPALHCDGCIAAVASLLEELPGVLAVNGQLQEKILTVAYEQGTVSSVAISAQLAEFGYPVKSVRFG